MNRFIESEVRRMPQQYLWSHRRFKTRPQGESNPYLKSPPS
jgi:KDO2-lipid IV(A) lauroyltransferase